MASSAVARETIVSLRHQIAKIEGRLAETFAGEDGDVHLRRQDGFPQGDFLATGAERFDAALSGGLPGTGLTEIHATGMRDVGAAAGFVMGLVHLLVERTSSPLLWVGLSESFREAGYPYPPGIRFLHGIDPSRLLIAQAQKLNDALWIAEQAASIDGFAAILLETRGPSAHLDLTATRRLHRRALDAGRPLFLLRQMAVCEPTAAPFRMVITSAPAGTRHFLGKPLARSIGPPAFLVRITKNRINPPSEFILEWNAHARAFHERTAADPVVVVPASQHRAPAAAALGTILAFSSPAGSTPAGGQPSGEQHPAHRGHG